MTLPNRIDPWGQFVATPERGTRMGNRGILHDARGELRRRWAHKAWVCCVLTFKDRQRARPWSTTGTSRGDLPWTAAGYGPPTGPREADTWVTVLTPPSVVAVLHHGYAPQLHPSAGDKAE